MMIAQPDFIAGGDVETARAELIKKGKGSPTLEALRLERLDEGAAAQIMHIGPYERVGESVAKLHQFMAENGCRPSGKHHEIYMSGPRRTAPEKLKTILRQPLARGA